MILEIKQFQKLELKQKLKHCINLFEIFIEKKKENQDWTFVMNTLNEINTFEYLDEWFYKYCEILPEGVLDKKSSIDDCEYINLDQHNSLKELYKNSKNKRNYTVGLLCEMGKSL